MGSYCGFLKIYEDSTKTSQLGLDDYVGNLQNITISGSGFLLNFRYPAFKQTWGVRILVKPLYFTLSPTSSPTPGMLIRLKIKIKTIIVLLIKSN